MLDRCYIASSRATDEAVQGRRDTVRTTVTLQKFLHFQIEKLVGIYGPSVSEVIGFVLQSWLHENDEKIQRQQARFEDFAGRRRKS
jgi:Arc/MetJ-type ribon-helix-helix transcriptional regulator